MTLDNRCEIDGRHEGAIRPGHSVQCLIMQLSRESIARVALDILDEFGLGDVTMRRVAATLGVAPGALYWHIANKQALIAALAELIIAPVVIAPVVTAQPSQPLALTRLLRTALLAHRDGADVVSSAMSQPDSAVRARLREAMGDAVAQCTPDADPAHRAATASGLLHLTLGAVAIEQAEQQLAEATSTTAELAPAIDHATHAHELEVAARLLLDGLNAEASTEGD